MRRIAIVVSIAGLVAACKKKPAEEPEPEPSKPPKIAHSVTKIPGAGGDDTPEAVGSAPAPGSASTTSAAPADAAQPDARPVGGNGKPSYRDDAGHPHGPGGPVYMGKFGKGQECDDNHDHCLRKDVWFAVANIVPGKIFRAVPVYELEGKWYSWRGEEQTSPGKLMRTEVAGSKPIPAGTAVVWFSSESSSPKWAESEYDGLTSSRWESGYTDNAAANGSVRIKGLGGTTTTDTIRLIVETK